MTTQTTPITVSSTHITGRDITGRDVNAKAGNGTYAAAPGADLTVYAAPTLKLIKGAPYTVTGVFLDTDTTVTFQNVTYVGPAPGEPAAATLFTTGWIPD